MSVCKITQLLTGVEYRAKSAAGVWRSLASDDALADGESVKVFSSGPEYGLNVYTLQNRVSGAWADALTIALDLPSGTSHTRTDKLTITGNATDSSVSIALTSNKGHPGLKLSHLAQLEAENTRGTRFIWKGSLYAGVISEITKGKERIEGGYLEDADARLVCNREQFADAGTMPLVGQTVTVEATRFVITGLGVSDVVFNLELRRAGNA